MLKKPVSLVAVILRSVLSAFQTHCDLVLENLALRQQVAVLKKENPRPRLSLSDRVFWVWLCAAWAKWSQCLVIVRPETVVRWHRQGFKLYWRFISKKRGRPCTNKEIRHLILRMAKENPTWGAPRIHGELLKLGYSVSERTVSRYLPRKTKDPRRTQNWRTFLENHRHAIAAMDFFTVPTATFRVLYVLFVIHHGRRKIVHGNTTEHPNSAWVIQQLREAFPYDTAPEYLIFDRDSTFGRQVVGAVKSLGIAPVRTSYRSPWQNGVAERWIGSCRRDMLDHVVVFGERHMRLLLREYVAYYNEDRCHYGLGKDAPVSRSAQVRPSSDARVVAFPKVGGLHHRYEWRKAS
jgi:transposase InsO family protein